MPAILLDPTHLAGMTQDQHQREQHDLSDRHRGRVLDALRIAGDPRGSHGDIDLALYARDDLATELLSVR